MQTKLVLYMVVPNKESLSYDIVSEHPDRYEECSSDIDENIDLDSQINILYSKYLDLDSNYIRFINMKPYIEDKILKIPFYCLIPYNNHEFKNSYKIPAKLYAKYIPDIRKILNII